MRARKAHPLPLIAVLAVAGGLLVAGCGSSSDSSSDGTTLKSQNAADTTKGDDAMKDEGDAMKHEDEAMKNEG